MLEGLEKVDWSRLTHPYGDGDACDIPDLLHELASDDTDARSDALQMLSCRVCDSPIETIAAVVPFLVELAAHPAVEGREEILDFLADIAGDNSNDPPQDPADEMHAQPWEATRAWSAAAREAVETGLPVFLDLLADEDIGVQVSAARVLAQCRGQASRLILELIDRIRSHSVPRVQAALILALEPLASPLAQPEAVVPFLTEQIRSEAPPVVRLAAALGLASLSPGRPSPEIVETLCETSEAAWKEFEESSGRATSYCVGQVLEEDPQAWLRFLLRPMDNPDPYIRKNARRAAAQLGCRFRSMTRAVASALGKRFVGAEVEDRREIAEILSGYGAAAAETLDSLIQGAADDDQQVRIASALALAGLHDLRALSILIDRLEGYRIRGESTAGPRIVSGELFFRLAEDLAGYGPAARPAVPTLVHLLEEVVETEYWRERSSSIAHALGRIGPDAHPAIPGLIALMKDQPSARSSAAGAVARIGGPGAREAIPIFVEWLQSREEAARIVAADALWRIERQTDVVLPVLIGLLQPGTPWIFQALTTIGAMGDEARAAIPTVAACLDVEDDSTDGRWLRLSAAVALWRVERRVDRALPVLIGLLDQPRPLGSSMMRKAAQTLGEMGAEAREAVPLLLRATAGDLRSTGRQYLSTSRDIRDDDALLATVIDAIRRIKGHSDASES